MSLLYFLRFITVIIYSCSLLLRYYGYIIIIILSIIIVTTLLRSLLVVGQYTFLVVYWGASNADISCVRCSQLDITSPLRLVGVKVARNCGGSLLTDRLVEHCRTVFFQRTSLGIESSVALGLLRAECEKAKCALSHSSSAVVSVPEILPGRNLKITVSRSLLNKHASSVVAEVVQCAMKLLSSLKISPQALTEVLLAGGSVQMPLFRSELKRALGKDVVITCDLNPMEVTAAGASVKAAFFEDIQCRQEIFLRLASARNLLLPADVKRNLSPDDVNLLVGDELQAGNILSVIDKFSGNNQQEEMMLKHMDEHTVDLAKVTYQARQFENFNALMEAVDQELREAHAAAAKSPKRKKALKKKRETRAPNTTALEEQLRSSFPLCSETIVDATWAPAPPDAPLNTPDSTAALFAPSMLPAIVISADLSEENHMSTVSPGPTPRENMTVLLGAPFQQSRKASLSLSALETTPVQAYARHLRISETQQPSGVSKETTRCSYCLKRYLLRMFPFSRSFLSRTYTSQ
jgi:hypothetical protein